ncbi:MAG: hypothetical protein GX596_04715 [Propionibacterium sp.]|nr:hypothetical protein [Propionibacterium sp.]
MEPQEIPLDTPVGHLDGPVLVETEAGRTLITRKQGELEREFTLHAHLPDGRRPALGSVPDTHSLRDAAASLSGSRPLRAFRVRGEVRSRTRAWRWFLTFVPMVLGIIVAILGLSWQSLGLFRFMLLAAGVTTVVVVADSLKKSQRYRQWLLQHEGEKVRSIDVPLPDLPEEIEVDDVKVEYGRLLSDIVYRIEYPALFDPQEPTTKAFTLALLQWDNNDGVVGDDERRELARRVRTTFQAARANAERLGMQHIPDESRERATTALGAARLATDEGSTDAERATALSRAIEILDQLALYYLPTGAQARKAVTGSAPLQLPGRKAAE